MKKTHDVRRNGTRKGGFRRKKELALALAVSLWLAGGSVAGAALAKQLFISNGTARPADGYPAGATVEVKDYGSTLSVTGGTWSADWIRFKAGSNQKKSNYKLNLSNATFEYDGVMLYGNYFSPRDFISGNAVVISDCTFNGKATIDGACGVPPASQNVKYINNTVTIAGSLGDDHLPKTRFLGATDIYAVFDEIPHNRQPNNLAYSNTVNLYGATAMEKVTLHGYNNNYLSSNGGNELHLGGTKDGNPVNDIPLAPWRGYALDNAGKVTSTVNNTVNQVDMFDAVVLHRVYWDASVPVLKAAGGFTNFGGELFIDRMTFANDVTNGTMTLLEGKENNFSTLNLTYKNATGATGFATLDSSNPSVVVNTGEKQTQLYPTGVTLDYSGTQHVVSLADNGKKVNYTIAAADYSISLGEMEWGKSQSLSGFTFNESTALDTTNLSFASLGTGTPGVNIRKDSATALVTDASGLPGGISRDHRQEFRDYGLSNGTTMTATLTGKVTTNSDQVRYTVDDVTVSAVDLAGWTGGTTPLHWTAQAGGVDVKAEGFTFTGSTAKKNIFEAYTSNFFSDAKITGAMKYTSAAFTDDTGKGVTYSGNSYSGVKANGAYLTYFAPAKDVTTISLGGMDWGTVDADNTYNFKEATVDASGLEFAFTPEQSAALSNTSTMTLLSSKSTTRTFGDEVINPNHTQEITGAATNGATLNGTLTGTVSAATTQKSGLLWGNVNYRATGMTLDSIDLATWDGTKDAATVPAGWTPKAGGADVKAEGFTMPDMAADTQMNIFKTAPAGTFGEVSGARIYSAAGVHTEDTAGGVTLSGTRTGGVERNGDGSNLIYHAETMTVDAISFGKAEWGTPRDGSAGGYNYAGAEVDASKLTFTNPEAVTDKGTLLTANNTLAAGKTVTGAAHTQDFTTTETNNISLSATLTGTVSTAAGTVNYVATGTTLNSVDLAKWDGKTDAAVPEGWTANTAGVSVATEDMTNLPEATANILTGGDFSKVTVSGPNQYKAADFTDGPQGVTLSGTQMKGVTTNEAKNALVYRVDPKEVAKISLGAADFEKGATLFDGSAASYKYDDNAQVNADNFSVRFDEKEAPNIAANDTMTLLAANAALADVSKETKQAYSFAPVEGVSVNAEIAGRAMNSADRKSLVYTVESNRATKLTFGDVIWKKTGALMARPTNIIFTGAAVDTTNIRFDLTPSGAKSLTSGDTMLLVSDFGQSLDKNNSEGTTFRLASEETAYKGHAEIRDSDLIFLVEQSTAKENENNNENNNNENNNNENNNENGNNGNNNNENNNGNNNNENNENGNNGNNNNENNNGGNNNGGNGGNNGGGEPAAEGEMRHSAVMGVEAAMAALSAGNDFIGDATEGLGLAANTGADGVSTFARLGGGKLRQTTGSHVDVNTWNAIIAIGKKNVKESKAEERDESQGDSSRITNSKSLRSQEFVIGAFFEYGSGNYTTHNGDNRGDGSARYTGGGLLAKWKQAGGLYVEGSLRAGTVKDDARNVLRDGLGNPYSYDTSAGYFGAHIGVGREIGLKGGDSLDVYAKYFHNRRNGVSFDAGPDRYDLDAVTSSVLRVGARYTMKREAWNFYGGLAYEYEMDGEARGVAGGLAIRGADMVGGSARLELGATMTPAKSPWTLDLNLTGFAGKKRGLMGGVSVSFGF